MDVTSGGPRGSHRSAADRLITESAYRPDIDGVRSVAVYLVVLFHAGVAWFAGGYVGVDVFFVLSGFLVTRLLVRDLAGGGTIGFARFYSRRFRRLLPASFVALVATALLLVAVDPVAAVGSVASFKAAFLYSANWYFIRESAGYFGAEVASNPVLQFWSLAVEEQFYLLWPLVLAVLFGLAGRLRRRRLLVVRLTVAVAGLMSLAWALHLRTGDPDRAYFGTDARAYQLLAGASIALVPDLVTSLAPARRFLRVVAPLAVVAIIVVGTSVGIDDPIVRGAMATLVTVAAIIALEGGRGGWATRVLSTPALVYLGRVSYGTYLWHWPVILVASERLDLSPVVTAVLTCLVATGLASLSFQLLEWPVRQSSWLDRHRLPVIATGLAISVLAALVVIPAIIEPPRSVDLAAASPTSAGSSAVPSREEIGRIFYGEYGRPRDSDGNDLTCVDAPAERCTVVHGRGPHLLLLGDSNAQMISGTLVDLAKKADLTLTVVVSAGCPWQRDYYSLTPAINERCRTIKEDAYSRVIPELDPDLIVAMNTIVIGDLGPDDPEGKPFSPKVDEVTTASVAELTPDGRRLVVIEPMPRPLDEEFEPLTCLGHANVVEECRFVARTEPTWYELRLRELAADNDRFWSADFDRLACPYLPICDPVIDGTVVWWDHQHLTPEYAATLADPIETYLRTSGLLAP